MILDNQRSFDREIARIGTTPGYFCGRRHVFATHFRYFLGCFGPSNYPDSVGFYRQETGLIGDGIKTAIHGLRRTSPHPYRWGPQQESAT